MAADCLMADGYECQYIDKDGKPTEKKTVAFHGEFKTAFIRRQTMGAADANLLGDLKAMSRVLTSKGCAAADVIAGADAAELIQSNSYIQKLFDNRRFEMGKIEPKLQESGALVLGFMNVDGVLRCVTVHERMTKTRMNHDSLPRPKQSHHDCTNAGKTRMPPSLKWMSRAVRSTPTLKSTFRSIFPTMKTIFESSSCPAVRFLFPRRRDAGCVPTC